MNIRYSFAGIVMIGLMIFSCQGAAVSENLSVKTAIYPDDSPRSTAFPARPLKSRRDLVDTAPVIESQPAGSFHKIPPGPPAPSAKKLKRKIGTVRAITELADPRGLSQVMAWHGTWNDGHTAVLVISSPGAKALRLGIIAGELPRAARFIFFAPKDSFDPVSGTLVTGEQINRLLQYNREADPDHPDSGTYWSPVIEGDRIGIEIYLPPGIDPETVNIAIPFLSHMDVSPFVSTDPLPVDTVLTIMSYGDSSACQNDAACYSAWLVERNAVAKIVFTESGETNQCTGTLLNTTDEAADTPYFITANHCIGSQTVASTLETHWFFESSGCNSTERDPRYTVRTGGAVLHWTGALTASAQSGSQDISFLQLNDTPPAGAAFAGWNTEVDSDKGTGIHHPAGDWKKLSKGDPDQSYIAWQEDDDFSARSSFGGNFVRVVWTDGGVEEGSSGSGLFNSQGQVVGTLLGGSGQCEGSDAYYSKFGAAYTGGNLSRWLDPETVCTYRLSSSYGRFASDGGTRPVKVTASNPDCDWDTAETLSWVALSPAAGTGSSTVTVTVSANTGSTRNGSVKIAGKTYVISQSEPAGGFKDQIARLYVATFNRAPDAPGLDYWENHSFGGSPAIEQIAMSFFDQPETRTLYPAGTTNTQFVTAIYQNLYNRSPDADGLAYWTGPDGLGGGMPRSVMIEALKNGAQGDDAAIIANKTEAGLYYAESGLERPAFSLAGITADPATVKTAKTQIDALLQ